MPKQLTHPADHNPEWCTCRDCFTFSADSLIRSKMIGSSRADKCRAAQFAEHLRAEYGCSWHGSSAVQYFLDWSGVWSLAEDSYRVNECACPAIVHTCLELGLTYSPSCECGSCAGYRAEEDERAQLAAGLDEGQQEPPCPAGCDCHACLPSLPPARRAEIQTACDRADEGMGRKSDEELRAVVRLEARIEACLDQAPIDHVGASPTLAWVEENETHMGEGGWTLVNLHLNMPPLPPHYDPTTPPPVQFRCALYAVSPAGQVELWAN